MTSATTQDFNTHKAGGQQQFSPSCSTSHLVLQSTIGAGADVIHFFSSYNRKHGLYASKKIQSKTDICIMAIVHSKTQKLGHQITNKNM